ncbi:MAG: T9SS type A sorting domain-containing protein [Porphyromonadaceae bacterium]|nr:T9SS type A sorting domain-containing protein [Porphyromonadaceae bacterium]
MYHNITRKLMSIVGIAVLFAMSISVLNAQNTISMTFSKYKDRETGMQDYKAGDKVSISFSVPEGKEVKAEGAVETKVVDGKNEFTLVADESGKGVKPIVITGDVTGISASYLENITIETLTVKSEVLESILIKYQNVENIVCDNSPKLKSAEFPYDETLKTASFENCSLLETVELNGPVLTVKPKDGIKSVNLKGCPSLKVFYCTNRNLETLDLSGRANLTEVAVGGNDLTSVNLKGCEKLETLEMKENKVESLDIEGCKSLKYISCALNKLSMDVSHKLVENLPQREATDKGVISFIIPVGGVEPDYNSMSTKDVELANSKNWEINQLDKDGGNAKPYKGESKTYEVTIEASEHGKIEIEDYTTDDLEEVEEDTELVVITTPDKGYKLGKLMANNEDITSTLKFTVTSDVTLKATFVEDKGEEPKPETDQKYNFGGVITDGGVSGFRFYYDDKDLLARIEYIGNSNITGYDSVYYNADKQMVRIDKYMDFSGQNNLKLDIRFDYEYDQVGNMVARKATNVPTGMSMGEYILKYDDEGRCVRADFPLDDIIMSEKFEYDAHGNMTRRGNYSRNADEDESKDVLKAWIDFKYDDKDNLIERGLYIRTMPTQNIEDVPCSEKYEMLYDDKNCMKEAKISQLNKRNQLVHIASMKYQYDEVKAENVNMPSFAYDLDAPYSSYNVLTNGMPLRRLSQGVYAPNKKKPVYESAYIYSFPASVKEVIAQDQVSVKVFPNPATDMITVDALDIKNVKVIGMNGEIVRNYPVNADRIEIPVESLVRGVYVVNVETATQTQSTKVVLK